LAARITLIKGVLRLSTKYLITGLRAKCISIFTRRIPITLDDFDRSERFPITHEKLNNHIETIICAITLAQEMSITDGLPFLYYMVATHISPQQLVNGTANLSWRNKTICMVAREKLRVAWEVTYAWLHAFTPSSECHQRQECKTAPGLRAQWSLVKVAVQDDPLLPFDKWKSLGVCQLCRDKAMARYIAARSCVWETLPALFNLRAHKS
jgi:hypothetical protein